MAAWSGLFDHVHGSPHALINSKNAILRRISMALETRGGRETSALALSLNGASAGATATATVAQVQALAADLTNLGGQRAITTKTLIDRASTSGDKTTLDGVYDGTFVPTSYPTDASRNSGGGRAMTIAGP